MTDTQRTPYTPCPVRRAAPGLNAKTYPLAVREDMAIDYEAKLSDEAREFLHRFNSAFHGGNFKSWNESDFSTEARREIWRDLKRAQKSPLALAAVRGLLVRPDSGHETWESILTEGSVAVAKPKAVPYPLPIQAPPDTTSSTAPPIPGVVAVTAVPDIPLPRIPVVGWHQTAEGWVAVSAVIQGGRVLSQQVHCTPQLKQYAAMALNQALMKKVVNPKAVVLNLDDEGGE